MKKYLTGIAVIAAILFLAIPLEETLGLNLHQLYGKVVGFFVAQSVVVAVILDKGEKDPEKLPVYGLGSIVFRLLTAIILLTILFVIGVTDAASLAIQFMVIYLSFLVFELTVLLTNLRRN